MPSFPGPPPAIIGYRQLSAQEVAVINHIKTVERQVLAVHAEVVEFISQRASGNPESSVEDLRWANMGKGNIETGFMQLARSVAKPNQDLTG